MLRAPKVAIVSVIPGVDSWTGPSVKLWLRSSNITS